MNNAQRRRITAGVGFFLALSFLGSWFPAAALRVFGLNAHPAPLGTRLLSTSLLYATTLGWQPLVAAWAVRRWIDPPDHPDFGLRPTLRVYSVVAVIAAVGLAAAATGAAYVASGAGLLHGWSLNGAAEVELVSKQPSVTRAVSLLAALTATILLIVVQSFAEEIGWRGYFLTRAMTQLGRWKGLVLHGAIWGCWYAPVLLFASDLGSATMATVGRCGAFVVTCTLLGMLLGWIRLASRSLVPAIVGNSTLTLAAGLPYVVHDVDAGMRSAIFGPIGWLVLGIAISLLLLSRYRQSVQIPGSVVECGSRSILPAMGASGRSLFDRFYLH